MNLETAHMWVQDATITATADLLRAEADALQNDPTAGTVQLDRYLMDLTIPEPTRLLFALAATWSMAVAARRAGVDGGAGAAVWLGAEVIAALREAATMLDGRQRPAG